jgi:hypothetical protein
MFPHANAAAKPATYSPGRVSRRRRASANAIFLTPRRQSVGRGLRRDGCMGALGRPARSLPPWCQTNLVLPVSSAVSVRCNAACEMEAVQKWPISRLLPRPRRQAEPRAVMPMSGPCEASRAIADVLAGRSLAAILPCPGRYAKHRGLWLPESSGRARYFLTFSAICGRRNE